MPGPLEDPRSKTGPRDATYPTEKRTRGSRQSPPARPAPEGPRQASRDRSSQRYANVIGHQANPRGTTSAAVSTDALIRRDCHPGSRNRALTKDPDQRTRHADHGQATPISAHTMPRVDSKQSAKQPL